jgi:hypothetical protein
VDDRLTLRFAPLWVLSALSGTYSRFADYELEAFWDVLVQVALRTPEPARTILTSTTEDRAGLLREFGHDGRPVVSGLSHTVAALERMGAPTGPDYRAALVRIAAALARSRGPFGRRVTVDDEQKLLLVAALLDVEPEEEDLLV